MKPLRPLLLCALLLTVSASSAADKAAAEKALKEAVKKPDVKAIEEACQELVDCAGKEALAPVLALLPKAEGASYWPLVSGAAAFHDEAALEDLGKFIVAHPGDARSCSADLVLLL